MILSFNEFNALNESNNYGYNDEYSNGSDILESLMTVIAKKGSITETQAYTFLDNVLYDTGWELNDEVYENYSEWLGDYASIFDATINESEEEMDIFLTRRGEMMLDEGKASDFMGKAKGAMANGAGKMKDFAKNNKKGLAIGAGIAGAGALAYGAHKLNQRRKAKQAGQNESEYYLDEGKASDFMGKAKSAMSSGLGKAGTFAKNNKKGLAIGAAGLAAAGGAAYALKRRNDRKKAAAAQQ